MEHHAQCTMNQDEEQGSFTPWADAGRHNPKQSHDLDPRAARLPALRDPHRTPEAEPQDCQHPEGETSRKTASARPTPDETSRKTAGARDDPTRRTSHPHVPTPFDKARLSARNRAFTLLEVEDLSGILGECCGEDTPICLNQHFFTKVRT